MTMDKDEAVKLDEKKTEMYRRVAYKIQSYPGSYYYGGVDGKAPTINSLASPAGDVSGAV